MRYLPHTAGDVERMLGTIGKPSIESLFAHIPDRLRAKRPLDIEPLDEVSLVAHLGDIGGQNLPAVGGRAAEGPALSFLGGGLTPHHIPAAVDTLLMRSEWYTSYTPYQPEISQGTLQAVFEFQTIVCELFGLGVANASMYDGASAAAEAVLMARRITGRHGVLTARSLHPHYRQTIFTYLSGEDPKHQSVSEVGWTPSGQLDLAALETKLTADVACLVLQIPSFFGVIDDVKKLADTVHKAGALLIVTTSEPLAFSVIEAPGTQGADIVTGEGMGLALSPTCGGPGVGLFAARAEFTRQIPGRLVGETVDRDGRRGYVLTLATREQHIRREKATSNICTNQGLVALAFTIHLCLLGQRGFRELGELNLAKAEYAKKKLTSLPDVTLPFAGPTFNEFTLALGKRNAAEVVEKLSRSGIFAGVPATQAGLYTAQEHNNFLVVTVTERNRKADIDRLADALAAV